MTDQMKLTLSKPVECPLKGTITELTFREPTGKDMRAMPVSGIEFGHFMKIAARLANVTDEVFDKMDPRDVTKAVGLVAPLLS